MPADTRNTSDLLAQARGARMALEREGGVIGGEGPTRAGRCVVHFIFFVMNVVYSVLFSCVFRGCRRLRRFANPKSPGGGKEAQFFFFVGQTGCRVRRGCPLERLIGASCRVFTQGPLDSARCLEG